MDESLSIETRLSEVYKLEAPVLMGYLSKRIDRDSAADIVQESFIQLYNAFKKRVAIENEKAYLFGIARNLLYKSYKQNLKESSDSIEAVLSMNIDGQNELSSGGIDNPETLVMKKDMLALLKDGLTGFTEEEKEIYELRWYHELKQKEIADIVKKSERQIRRDLEKIVKKLRETFQKNGWYNF